MKRICTFFVVVAVILSMFTINTFAANYSIKIGDTTYSGTGDLTLPVIITGSNTTADIAFDIIFNGEAWKLKSATCGDIDISGDAGVISDPNDITVYTQNRAVTSGSVFANFVFEPIDESKIDNSTFYIDTAYAQVGDDYNIESGTPESAPFKVVLAKPDVVVEPETNTEVAGYTDVVNFSSSLTNVTATNPTLTFDLYENGEFHKAYEEPLGYGITLDEGTLSFKIAIYGAPATGVTLRNPAVK